MYSNQNKNQNNSNLFLRKYTRLEVQNMITVFFSIAKTITEDRKKLESLSQIDSIAYRNLQNKILREKEVCYKLAQDLQYIIQHPERIFFRTIPVAGLLKQYKNIQENNKTNYTVIENLKTVFENIRYKIGTKESLPHEFSVYHLDLEIYNQKQKIKELKKIVGKLEKTKNPSLNFVNSIISSLTNLCDEDAEEQEKKLQEISLEKDLENLQYNTQIKKIQQKSNNNFLTDFIAKI